MCVCAHSPGGEGAKYPDLWNAGFGRNFWKVSPVSQTDEMGLFLEEHQMLDRHCSRHNYLDFHPATCCLRSKFQEVQVTDLGN